MNTETKWLDVPDKAGLWCRLYKDGTVGKPFWVAYPRNYYACVFKYAHVPHTMPEPPKREFEPIEVQRELCGSLTVRVISDVNGASIAVGNHRIYPQPARELIQAIESAIAFVEDNQ